MKKFYTATGWLTPYALACGYIELRNDCRLYRDGCYHVQGRGNWETFSTLTEARAYFRKLSA